MWAAAAVALTLALLVGIAAYAWSELPRPPTRSAIPTGDPDPPPELSREVESDLLDLYMPVLYLAPGENWRPIPVREFLRDSCISRQVASKWSACRDQDPAAEESALPRGAGVRLDVRVCQVAGGPECYQNESAEHELPRGAVYSRVYRNTTGQNEAVGYVLQFWLFYYFNDWQNDARNPTVWQFHEGDWEVVNVGLTEDLHPIYAAYSRHCTGGTRQWIKVETRDSTHPVVYVARGSHGNFFEPGPQPGSDECLPDAIRALDLDINNVDATGLGLSMGPGGKLPIDRIALSDVPWLSFQGAWGEGNFIRYVNNRGARRSRAAGASPLGPAQHRHLWSDPVTVALADWSNE